jgi:probable HAF family extracellular repeat protein
VGWTNLAGSTTPHAFVYSGSTMTDLNALIDPSSGWTLQEARSINDSGQIAGFGYHKNQGRPGGTIHAFLLTPVPEPTTLVLLGISFCSIVLYARRKR